MKAQELNEVANLVVYESSIAESKGVTYFMGTRGTEKLVGCVGAPCLPDSKKVGEVEGGSVCVGGLTTANAQTIRTALTWTAPKCLGLGTSIGFGDRLGLATPGHVRAVRGSGLAPIFPQQSIREMKRTQRTPQQVIDCATWGVLQEGWTGGFGSDADHLQHTEDIDSTVKVGFTMFTIDPGLHVDNDADTLDAGALRERYDALDFETLAVTGDDLKSIYTGRKWALSGYDPIEFDDETFLRAAVKYGSAIAHSVKMHRHLRETVSEKFELEVSVDETETPTSPIEHYFFAAELQRLDVRVVSLAPRFVGRFEKGVDYIGDLDQFRRSFAKHVAVMRTLGAYKISIHSGSDKFSIYPIVAEMTEGMVHLKTAGTSYLEALRAIAGIDPGLFREVLDFAISRYDEDKATYHVSAELEKVPAPSELKDEELAQVLDQFDARQVLHVTFGSVLTVDDGERFRKRIIAALEQDEEAHYLALEKHLKRHVAPFIQHPRPG